MGVMRVERWAERQVIVDRWTASGLSMAEFCRREGIGYQRFIAWRKRLAGTADEGGFAELLVGPREDEQNATGGALVEIALPCGVVVRAFEGADVALLRAAVLAVRGC